METIKERIARVTTEMNGIDNQNLFRWKRKKSSDFSKLLDYQSTPAGARTLDTLIKSQVLYQLSYGCIISDLRVQRYGVILNPPNFFETFFSKK